MRHAPLLWLLAVSSFFAGCRTVPRSGGALERRGDEIIVCGRLFHTGTPVVTWMDPGGYDAYRVERKFAPADKADWNASHTENPALESPNRYGFRRTVPLSPERLERVRTNGWALEDLQVVVDQFVLHYDVSGTSRRCFQVLHDQRGLSVHFMLDVDGTVYQTLDLKERAWHATSSNSRGIGIEIAQVGAVPVAQRKRLEPWYSVVDGQTRLTIPEFVGPSGIRTPNFQGRPARNEPVIGPIHGESMIQYDFTPEQYAALAKLTASLCRIFPKLRCDYPRDTDGKLLTTRLPDASLTNYAGILGHYHIQKEKQDPGPAFQWERLVTEARKEMGRKRIAVELPGTP